MAATRVAGRSGSGAAVAEVPGALWVLTEPCGSGLRRGRGAGNAH